MTKESVATLKAAFVADVTTMQEKFLGLANAFPQDKYTWKPMDGRAIGGRSADAGRVRRLQLHPEARSAASRRISASREEAAKLRTLSDKAQVIEHLNKGFAHAKKELEAIDPATLTGKRKVFGQDRSAAEIAAVRRRRPARAPRAAHRLRAHESHRSALEQIVNDHARLPAERDPRLGARMPACPRTRAFLETGSNTCRAAAAETRRLSSSTGSRNSVVWP